jgi:predicted amidohydrolase
MCNRVGQEGKMNFAGESLVVSADGEIMVKTDDAERIIYTNLDMRESERIRKSKSYISLRRTEMYL